MDGGKILFWVTKKDFYNEGKKCFCAMKKEYFTKGKRDGGPNLGWNIKSIHAQLSHV
jgi:hypothetical protein